MSAVVRSAYRQVLRVGSKISKDFPDPNDLCFAVFGIMLSRRDFAAAGYGDTFQTIAHQCFVRPSVVGDQRDSPSARVAAAFAMLRRLNALDEESGTASVVRRQLKETADRFYAELDRKSELARKSPSDSGDSAAPTTDRAVDSSPLVGEGKHDNEDPKIVVAMANLLIERSQQHKVQRSIRHIVLCNDREKLPPYPCLLPPEPMYPINIREDRPFHLMRDAILCMAATSLALQQQAARWGTESGACVSETSPPPLPPLTQTDTTRVLESIPTRSVARTDFMEVEVYTQYACPNAHKGSGGDEASDVYAHLFLYYVFIRNLRAEHNPKKWHAQIISQHLAVFDPDRGAVVEMVRPGVMGNFPLLSPGESHTFETGTGLMSSEGVLRGTIQVNALSETGETRTLDIALPPTRLSTRATLPPETGKQHE